MILYRVSAFVTIFWLELAYSKSVPDQKNMFDVQGSFLQPEERNYDPQTENCCAIPICIGNDCHDTISCGYQCTEGEFRTISVSPTGGYRLKTYYEKYECHFGECRNYRFLCNHCPDPRLPDFSVHTLRRDCTSCYH